MTLLCRDAKLAVQKRIAHWFPSAQSNQPAVPSMGKSSRPVVSLFIWLTGLTGLLFPTTAWGQAGIYLRPALSIAEYYDDNVFRSTSGRKDDFVSRLGGWLEGGYESEPLQLLGHYGFASEIFAKNPQLTKALSLQDAGVDFRYLPTRLWTLEFSGRYIETQQPETINVPTGILGERTEALSYSLSPSLLHQWDALTTLSSFYVFNRNAQEGGVGTDSHTVDLEIDREFTVRDTLSLAYIFRRFHVSDISSAEDSDDEKLNQTVHAATIGWTRRLSPLTTFTLRIGPRFALGTVTPEVLASIWRELSHGTVTLAYERTQYTIIGRGGPVNTDSVILSWDTQLAKSLFLNVTPAFYKNTGNDLDNQVYQFEASATYMINKWLAFRSSYQLKFEEAGSAGSDDRYRNLVLFELVAFSPFRVL